MRNLERQVHRVNSGITSEEGFCPGMERGGEERIWGKQNGWMGWRVSKVYGVSHRYNTRGTGSDTGSTKDGVPGCGFMTIWYIGEI